MNYIVGNRITLENAALFARGYQCPHEGCRLKAEGWIRDNFIKCCKCGNYDYIWTPYGELNRIVFDRLASTSMYAPLGMREQLKEENIIPYYADMSKLRYDGNTKVDQSSGS